MVSDPDADDELGPLALGADETAVRPMVSINTANSEIRNQCFFMMISLPSVCVAVDQVHVAGKRAPRTMLTPAASAPRASAPTSGASKG